TEWARSWQVFGGPWDVLGASQWQHPAVLALAAVGGVWLVSFALVAANTAIAILLLARALAVRAVGAAGVAVTLAAGPVAFALSTAVPPVRHVSVALVQPGITSGKTQRVDASLQLSGRLGASRSRASRSRASQPGAARPDLIVWGESSVGTDIERQPVLFGQIRRLAAGTGAQVLVNQDASLPDGARSKVALLIGPHGIVGSYTKTRLVPFGEYIPLRGALGWIARISKAAASNMVPGDGAHLVHATDRLGRPLPLGVLICFESAFPDMSRFDTDLGAQLLVYQTSDSTFQRTWAPAQHAALSAVRAAETGRPVVQAALTGDTVAFDARGRLLAQMTTQQRGVTMVRLGLPPAAARTAYDQLGDYVPWAATGIVLAAAITGFLMVRRARGGRVPWDSNPRRARSVSTVGASPGNSGEGQH
ncbi:MAG: apolipoprotein N-acyltransferase, partial [Pseudonocardiales bacterium]